MELVAPSGPVYQAGTLSANPLAMCAGLATLRRLQDGSAYQQLESLGARLERALAPLPLNRTACRFDFLAVHIAPGPSAHADAHAAEFSRRCESQLRGPFHTLLERGIYLAPSAFEVGFLSTAHTESQVDALAEALAQILHASS
jgi:glutamate-1-semialdehyde 2,1-aminomutase